MSPADEQLTIQVTIFISDLITFALKRHELLKQARGKSAPLAAKLALRENEKAFECFRGFSTIGDCEKNFKLGWLVDQLQQAKAFLERDALMDGVAVGFMDTPVHRSQLEKSTELLATVTTLLEAPTLQNIEPERCGSPWRRDRENKIDAAIQCYAFELVSNKKKTLLEELSETKDIGYDTEEEIRSLTERFKN